MPRYFILRQPKFALVALLPLVLLAACQEVKQESRWPDDSILFGDQYSDSSPVVCTVGDLTITQNDLDMRFEELTNDQKNRFRDVSGKRLLLRFMVDEALMIKAAYDLELYNDTSVARSYIMYRREVMKSAMQNIGLLKDKEPSVEQIREYYEAHREDYRRQGRMHIRHVQTDTKQQADAAWERLQGTGRESQFNYVVRDFSTNRESKKIEGDVGWFNRGGFVPYIKESREFTEAVWHLDIGVHKPLQVGDYWHIVEVFEREYGRAQTLEEAYDKVLMDYKPIFQQEILDRFLTEARVQTSVEYFGDYRPGEGRTAKELLSRAMTVVDTDQKLLFLDLIIDDYGTSEYADDALFFAGNIMLDDFGDRRQASAYLQRLVDEFPTSEYAEDAQYMIDNMYSVDFEKPTSIEELQKN